MIRIVTGTLGAGKTLYCVSEIYDALCRGEYVATNINLYWDRLEDFALRDRGVYLDSRQLVRLDLNADPDWHLKIPWGEEGGATVKCYLDEIHLFFNARDWATTTARHKQMLSFLTQSRKAFVDVTFIAQEVTTVEKQFRIFCEYEYGITSTDHIPLGWLGKLPFKAFIAVQRDGRLGHVLKRHWRSYDKRYFRLYDSFSFLDSEMTGLAEKAVRVPRIKLARAPASVRARRWVGHYLANVMNYLRPKKCASSSF